LLEESKICIAMREKLPKDSGKAGERHYDELVDRLKLKPQAKGQSKKYDEKWQPQLLPLLILVVKKS
jgi:hypothetical protein